MSGCGGSLGTRDRRRKLAERPCLLGADFVGISSDYTTPLPGAIAPRLLVVRRKTGYLDLSPDPGDCVHDIFKFTRSPLGGGIYRTSAGRCRTAYSTEIKSDVFFLENHPITFHGFAMESYRR